MIAQVEKDFFEYTKKLEEGTIEQVRLIGSHCVAHPACRWLLSRAAARTSLWEPLSSTQSSTTRLSIGECELWFEYLIGCCRLLEFFEKGGTVDLQASDDR